MDAPASRAQDCAPMGQPPDQSAKKKGLSAHQAGIPKAHGKITYDPGTAGTPNEKLTPREAEILLRVAEDKSDNEIGKECRIEVPTVKKHLENIYKKIHVKSRSSAAIWLLRQEKEALRAEVALLKEMLAKTGGSSAAPPP